jgi:hypothetical protein
LTDSDSEEDIGEEGEDANDQVGRHEGLADDEDDEEDDDGGLFYEGEDKDEERDGDELFEQWDENEVGAEALAPQAAPIGEHAGNQVGGAAPPPVAAAVADNEEAEGNVEDDMEGAMEGYSYSCGLL